MRSVLIERMKDYTKNTINEDKYEIVGAEIKNRRIKMCLTLDALADGICSLSYLCKIENNKIEPNVFYLRELCNRLELSDKQVDVLLDLRNILEECIDAYANKDYDIIDSYYEKCVCFNNYRADLLKLIYNLVHHNIIEANKIYLDLIQIAGTMREFDFVSFSIFSSILHYYNFRFYESLELLNPLNKYRLSRNLEFLRFHYTFLASFGANKADTLLHYNNLIDFIFKEGFLDYLNELRYNICLYYLKNGCDTSFSNELTNIEDEKYYNTLIILNDFKNKNISNILNLRTDNISDYARMLKLYINDFDSFKKEIEERTIDYYQYDYDYNLLDFLRASADSNFSKYLFDVLIPRVTVSDDEFIKNYIISEVIKMPLASGKNRIILKTVLMLYRFNEGDSYFYEFNNSMD